MIKVVFNALWRKKHHWFLKVTIPRKLYLYLLAGKPQRLKHLKYVRNLKSHQTLYRSNKSTLEVLVEKIILTIKFQPVREKKDLKYLVWTWREGCKWFLKFYNSSLNFTSSFSSAINTATIMNLSPRTPSPYKQY